MRIHQSQKSNDVGQLADGKNVKSTGSRRDTTQTPSWMRGKLLQSKPLTISAPSDGYEREADAIANQVMRQPTSSVQRRCACGGIAGADGECAACKAKRLQREVGSSSAPSVASESEAPASVHQTLAQPGQALGTATRHFMESRFGQDFSHVRVHTDSQAAQSAADVNARAYTVGNNVVFGAGQYQPQTPLGLHLLAHELVHTVQQLETRTGILQRVCGAREISPRSQGCIGRGGDIDTYGGSSENLYLFEANCDDFIADEEQRLRDFALSIGSHDTVTIDGFASEEGAADFNEELSCARANHAARVLVDVGVTPGQIIGIYNHGATRGDRPSHRSVVISITHLQPEEHPQPVPEPSSTPRNPSDAGVAPHASQDLRFLDLQIACIIRLGGCPQTRPAGIPSSDEIGQYDTMCRNETQYNGTPVTSSDLYCSEPGRGIGESLSRAYPGWLDILPDCPCTLQEAIDSPLFEDRTSSFTPTYHPGATHDYRSTQDIRSAPGTAHGQQCTYDAEGRLLTEGPAAGTPDVWRPGSVFSTNFWRHQRIDVDPWETLGSASYNRYWVPNRGAGNCAE